MANVSFNGQTFNCTTAIKGADYIHLLDADGLMIAAFDGVTNFSAFSISFGSWKTPTPENECYMAVVKDDGTIGKGGHRCNEVLTEVPDGAVTAAKIASGAVTEAKIGGSAVTTEKIKDGAVTPAKLSTAIPITSGGTNATTRRLAAFNITCIGTNPVTVETDTPQKWAELGVGFAYVDELGVVIDQPSQYGFIVSNNYGNVVVQTWMSYGAAAATYHRSGNAAGWQNSWIRDFNEYNLNPATLDSNGKVTASQASSAVISISSSTTLGASHCGKFLNVYSSNGSAITLTIPDSTALPVDTEIEVFRMNSGAVKITCASTIALRGRGTKTNYGETYSITERYTSAVLKKLSTTMWAVAGAECES